EVFDDIKAGILKERSQFWTDTAVGFFGANREDNRPSHHRRMRLPSSRCEPPFFPVDTHEGERRCTRADRATHRWWSFLCDR
ncbi:hypothetical protein ACWD6K_23935, partial [Streptomyces sp. NPDC002431]